ncbi:hypothetical protein D3C80_1942550 [compost metagenome]
MAEAPSLTEANAVIPAVHHDGGVKVPSPQLEVLTELRDVLATLFFPLLSLLNALRHRAQRRHHHHQEQNHHRRHQVGE